MRKLGVFPFQKGTYIYAGSTKRNLKQKIDCHFDYLRPYETITRIITYDYRFGECELAENIRKKEAGSIPIKCSSYLI